MRWRLVLSIAVLAWLVGCAVVVFTDDSDAAVSHDTSDTKVSAQEFRQTRHDETRAHVHERIGPGVWYSRVCNAATVGTASHCTYRYRFYNPYSFGKIRFVRHDGHGPLRVRIASIWHCPQLC